MKDITLPPSYNYIGVFLTLRCNLGCDYCINKYGEFSKPEELSTAGWIEGLKRIQTRPDLPISIQGGEPLLHPGFYEISNALYKQNKHLDLLKNGTFDVREFAYHVSPEVFKREAKYASIRVSFHQKTHPMAQAIKVWELQNSGYEIGVWAVDHPDTVNAKNPEMQSICKWLNIDYRTKEFLGVWNGKLYGTYKYPESIGKRETKRVWCKPSELLINPAGYIFRCHADLYANRDYIGHVLDKEVSFPGFRECKRFGNCNPCDVKLKTNRLQEFGHCSVTIKGKGIK